MKIRKSMALAALITLLPTTAFHTGIIQYSYATATVGIPEQGDDSGLGDIQNDDNVSESNENESEEQTNETVSSNISYNPQSGQENNDSTPTNEENKNFIGTLQESVTENPSGSKYTDDYAYYKVGGLTDQPGVKAPSAILMDATTGFVLYSKNASQSDEKKYYPASMTKVVTALVAIENGNLDDIIEFSDNAVNKIPSDATRAGFAVGDRVTLREALYGLFMASGADSAVAIAEHYGGTVDEFVRLMNTKAQQLGCLDTNFVNPHGMHDANHYMTSYDMALIMQDAIKYQEFRDILGTKSYTVKSEGDTQVQKEIKLQNRSALLSESNENYYEFAMGSKTGHTNAAKYTLVSYAVKGNETLICVTMEEEDFDSCYSDHKKLYEWGYRKTQVLTPLPDQSMMNSVISAAMTDDKFSRIQQLSLKYKSSYGVLTNSAINKDEIRTMFVYDEDINSHDGVLGYIYITYYNKVLIGKTPILYETSGTAYNEYLDSYNGGMPIITGSGTETETPDSTNSDYYDEPTVGIGDNPGSDYEQTEDIDPFVDTSMLEEHNVASLLLQHKAICSIIILIICGISAGIIFIKKRK